MENMEKNQMPGHPEGCQCMGCRGDVCSNRYGHHHWCWILLRIFAAILIFWLGFQFGELKTIMREGYPDYGYKAFDGFGSRPIMMGWGTTSSTITGTTTVQ